MNYMKSEFNFANESPALTVEIDIKQKQKKQKNKKKKQKERVKTKTKTKTKEQVADDSKDVYMSELIKEKIYNDGEAQ